MANKKYNISFYKKYPGDYTDNKGRVGVFRQVGTAIEKEDGSFSGFFESIPINWNGQFKLFPRDDKYPQNAPVTPEEDNGVDPDIPF